MSNNELHLKVFVQYMGHEPGKGHWPLERDRKQLAFIARLVDAWEARLAEVGGDLLEYNDIMNCAYSVGERDRSYTLQVRDAYNAVRASRGRDDGDT